MLGFKHLQRWLRPEGIGEVVVFRRLSLREAREHGDDEPVGPARPAQRRGRHHASTLAGNGD